jgi:hypothetical protein
VYFTFLDRALGYDCVRCGSRCCQGWGFGLPAEELIPFLGKSPRLAPFLMIKQQRVDAFGLSDGCWMLEPDGRCAIENQDGRAAKPAVCRLFPLQPRRLAGEVIVDLRLSQCPVEDAKGLGAGGAVIDHASAAAEVLAFGGPFTRSDSVPPGAPADLVAREAQIRDATADLLDLGDSAAVIARAHGLDGGELTSLRARWRSWLGLDSGLDAARTFALAIPSLRMAAITAVGAAPWPRLSRALPGQLLATSFYMELSARAGRAVTLRGIAEMWRSTASVRQLLARWTDPPKPLNDEPRAELPGPLRQAFDQVANRLAGSTPIGEALESTEIAVELRPLLVRLVADRSL